MWLLGNIPSVHCPLSLGWRKIRKSYWSGPDNPPSFRQNDIIQFLHKKWHFRAVNWLRLPRVVALLSSILWLCRFRRWRLRWCNIGLNKGDKWVPSWSAPVVRWLPPGSGCVCVSAPGPGPRELEPRPPWPSLTSAPPAHVWLWGTTTKTSVSVRITAPGNLTLDMCGPGAKCSPRSHICWPLKQPDEFVLIVIPWN